MNTNMHLAGTWRHAMVGIITLAVAGMLASPLMAQQRQLGTVGPPPRETPQRTASAEGMPPLPLPAVPLRRSEPKAEPAPPIFAARLAYGDTQDYMPNPGDLDNLFRHVRQQLDAWYGHSILTLDELVALHQQGQINRTPMLYITGYEAFSFTDAQRAALRDYLLDGGTLLGDATLGSPAFVQSFTREMALIFPDRKLDTLQPDHPIFRGYYPYQSVHYFTIEDGARSRTESVPQMLGMNLAARTAVILSPYDMTCGWDEFYAPAAPRVGDAKPDATRAMMPADALRMGINLVAYVSAQRDFAQSQAFTRRIEGTQHQPRAAVKLGLLRHQGDWNADPNSLYQLIRLAAANTSIPMSYELKPVDAQVAELVDTPMLIMTGMDEPALDEQQIAALRRHLQAGGFLFINNTSGYAKFDRAVRDLVARLLPEQSLAALPADHELYSALHHIEQVRHAGTGEVHAPALEAVTVDGRTLVVYSPTDTLAMIKGIHDPYANAYASESAQQLALNILCHAMQQ